MNDETNDGQPKYDNEDPVIIFNIHPTATADSVANRQAKYGECILCGNYAALTGEHIFAAWMGRASDDDAVFTLSKFSLDKKWASSFTKEKYGHKNGKLDVLCGPCNHNWSSTIQKQASKILEPIIKGESTVHALSFRKRRLLAIWTNLFVIVRQYLHPELISIHRDERTSFRRGNTPITDASLWIASFKANDNFYSDYRAFNTPNAKLEGQDAEFDSFMCALSCGNMVIISYRSKDDLMKNMCLEGQLAMRDTLRTKGFVEIWPPYSKIPSDKHNSLSEIDMRGIIGELTQRWQMPATKPIFNYRIKFDV